VSTLGAGLLLAGISAVASSSAHALLKGGDDKFAVQAWSCVIAMLAALPFVFWVGLPETATIPWLLAGWVLHTIYYVVLIWSYNSTDFSVAFPIARGITPIATAILGIVFLGDNLSAVTLTGIFVISGGIVLLSFNQSITRSGLVAALLTGLINTVFTIVDAKGMRVADSMMNFLVWYYILDGFSMPMLFAARAKLRMKQVAMDNARHGLSTGFVTLFAFVPTLIAYRLAPVGAVSAIRATSVIFSLLIGRSLLSEALDGKRIGGAILVVAGALAIIAGSAF
jgi:drug/metabolite transporter (DMT)-like permease